MDLKAMKCKNCQSTFISSWTNQQSKYGKARGHGFTHEQAREIVDFCPICFKNKLSTTPKKARG